MEKREIIAELEDIHGLIEALEDDAAFIMLEALIEKLKEDK